MKNPPEHHCDGCGVAHEYGKHTKPLVGEAGLRIEISNLMTDLMLQTKLIQLDDRESMLKQGRKLIATHSKRLDVIMALIASYGARVDVEAKLDELEGVEEFRKDNWTKRRAYPDWNAYYKKRRAFLQKHKKKLSEGKNNG
jgi:hypothetical protein